MGVARKLFCKNRRGKVGKNGGKKSNGYSIEFWEGEWIARRVAYYDRSLRDMPVICETRCSLQSYIDRAILDTVLGFVEEARMEGRK